ncbi:hypothetical protein RND71_005687 [Anisodus tanguticus]|uniref:Protein ZIP4 homolog n=1 Tax=Anisodus tanguticus TaxID=243964 RepID=A0AAE1VVP3_9SOLA|nr:hypothetical protein RND71_005687 [Anisodus tanguticus]
MYLELPCRIPSPPISVVAISQLNSLSPYPNSVKLHIWKLSYRLWNACVDHSNAAGHKHDEEHAKLRQVSADLLFLASDQCYRKNEVSGVNEALRLMNDALELCERGLTVVKRAEETLGLKELRSKTRRFLAASHLQRDKFESVLKCVKVLRDSEKDEHPSLSVLAMKAWLGLGRYGEAEKELRGMVLDKGIPVGVWVSAVESYFQVVGAASAAAVKGVFLGLVGRCHVSADAAIRAVNKVIEDTAGGAGEEARLRAKVVSDLVSDDRILTLLSGDDASKERTAMHALLWNCAEQHFRSKDLQTSADIFEKSMLYVPYDIESRNLRAEGFSAIWDFHSLSLEPNIANVFLKFKIYLQKNKCDGAITQVQAMPSCLDFTTEFLSLAAHEAIACRCLPVAVASLSLLLNFYSTGKQMPTTEVVVFRTLVTILSQDPQNDSDILKQMKRAHSRLCEMGAEKYFGKEFYGASIDEEKEGNHVMICKSLIMTVSAIISDEKQRTNVLLENEVKEAISLLDSRKATKWSYYMLMSSSTESDKLEAIIEPNFLFVYTGCAFDLHSRLDDAGSQHIKRFTNSKCCNPKHLLQIGIDASQGPRSNHEVAIFALSSCLSTLPALPSPDYVSLALILRKLVSLRSIHGVDTNDDATIEKYKQAYLIMVDLKEGEYPIEEAKWLVMTAWNRAAVPVRMGHMDEAKRWMSMGLDLAKKVPGMQTYRSCMEDFVAGFEKKLSGA